MKLHDETHALNRALDQRDRALLAPAPERVKVDGRSLADLLAFSAEYGTLFRYYRLDNIADGDWSVFFSSDPGIALAVRAALELPALENELDQLLGALRSAATEQRHHHWRPLEAVLLRLVGLLGTPDTGGELVPALNALASGWPAGQAETARRLAYHLAGAGGALGRQQPMADERWFDQLLALLEDLLGALLDALSAAQRAAMAALDQSLLDHHHAPQAAMWIAFAHLFRHAQARLNQFPRELVRFYHACVLQQDERAGRPGQVILSFTPAKGVLQTAIAQGTAFLAGKDEDGQPITYALDSALTVNASTITALHTLGLAPQGQVAAAQLLTGAVALSATPPAIGAPFPLFGASQAGVDGALASSLATLGFSVAGDCLLLAGGSRTVSVGLALAPACLPLLAPAFAACGLETQDAAVPGLLAQLLQASLALRYSSGAGWSAVAAFTVTAPATTDGPYLLGFTLAADAAPVTAPAAAPASAPTLQAILCQQGVMLDGAMVYPYRVLSCVMLSGLSLAVAVDALPAADMATPTPGPVQPFPLFGSPPVQNASYAFSAPELFVKQIDSFSMRIDWCGLPVTSDGFAGYYQGYVIDADGQRTGGTLFDNASFTVGMSVVNPGTWQTGAPWSGYLFQTSAGLPLPANTAAPLAQTVLAVPVVAGTPAPYYNPASSYVSLCLTQPAYAFGNVLYAPNVMAASLQLTTAASACASQAAQDGAGSGAAARLALLSDLCAGTPDAQFQASMASALPQVVAGLDGAALAAIQAAIAQGGATPATRQAWETSLAQALATLAPAALLQRLRARFQRVRPQAGATTLHQRLAQWMSEHGGNLSAAAPALAAQAQALLAVAGDIAAAGAQAASMAPPQARATITAAITEARTALGAVASQPGGVTQCLQAADTVQFPNQPWLPLAAGVYASYGATAALPAPAGGNALAFCRLLPDGQAAPVAWQAGETQPLLAPVAQAAALTIELSAPVQDISLLFRLQAPPAGWPTDTPAPAWSGWNPETGWTSLAPRNDSTGGLRKSGIVRFVQDGAPTQALRRLRVSLAQGDGALFPLLAALSANAATATWIGPGGASDLATPLPPGSIGKPLAPLPAIGAITQAAPSWGGRARASGPAFDMWLAERLRHKDRGIDQWDYANLVLADYPVLWQVAVTPASDGHQLQRPGHVWLVAVPGPDTPDVADPTVPSNDAALLGQIADGLAGRISPFIQLHVSNPPYQRLCVAAELLFGGGDSVPACLARLDTELIAFLSPWEPRGLEGLVARPANYYTAQEVAHFIRHRPYVRAILSFELLAQDGCAAVRPYYTSALAHQLTGKAASAQEPLRRPALGLAAAGAAA